MKQHSNIKGRKVYVVDGNRTPFLKARGVGLFSGSDLAVAAGKPLLNRQKFAPHQIDEVIIGSVMPGPDEINIARLIALRLGCGDKVPAFTVMRNCASGMQALDSAAMQIASGRSDLILAGGTEAMSHAPLLFNLKMASWLANYSSAKTIGQKLKLLTGWRPSYLVPVVALLRGLTDPLVNLNMGQTAEKIAFKFGITREQMDEFAQLSHLKCAKAYEENTLSEISPIISNTGGVFLQDDGFRTDSSLEKLAKLKSIFDKKYGLVTAGNSSQITDGACLLLLASAAAVKKYDLNVMGRIVDSQWVGLDPSEMGLGPVHAMTPILERQGLKPKDIDAWEINEAFAAQVLACLAAWNDQEYCQQALGLKKALGAPLLDKVNREGGAIAIGHPIGASGARIVLHLLHSLEQRKEHRGMAALCIGGGQGGAMYLEAVREVQTDE